MFLKSSFVFHKVANAPISTAIATPTATIGADIPPIAAPSLLASFAIAGKPAFDKSTASFIFKIPVLNDTSPVFALLKAFGTLPKTETTVPILDVNLPTTSNTGAIAATTKAHFAICSFCSGVNSCIFCIRLSKLSTNFLTYGKTTSPNCNASS